MASSKKFFWIIGVGLFLGLVVCLAPPLTLFLWFRREASPPAAEPGEAAPPATPAPILGLTGLTIEHPEQHVWLSAEVVEIRGTAMWGNLPAGDVTVTTEDGQSVATDSDGRFSFVVPMPEGQSTIVLKASRATIGGFFPITIGYRVLLLRDTISPTARVDEITRSQGSILISGEARESKIGSGIGRLTVAGRVLFEYVLPPRFPGQRSYTTTRTHSKKFSLELTDADLDGAKHVLIEVVDMAGNHFKMSARFPEASEGEGR